MNTEIQKAFHEAVGHNDIETARRMIAAGADVNAPYDEYENRSFLDACYSGNLAMVKMLVEAGTDVNLPDACGVVPLVRAIVSLKDADEVIKYLIASGADVSGRDGSMSLPLHVAVSENDIKIAAQLLAAGANPNIEDDEGKNALFGAVENGNERMLLLLLNHGADVNHEDEDGYTPLSLACIKGNVELCKLPGYTPLLLALRYRNKAAATLLIKHGADPLATGGKHNEDAYATCMRYRICLYDFIHIFSSIPNCERMKECLFNYLQNSICAEEKDVQNEAIQELLKRGISTKDVT